MYPGVRISTTDADMTITGTHSNRLLFSAIGECPVIMYLDDEGRQTDLVRLMRLQLPGSGSPDRSGQKVVTKDEVVKSGWISP
jgi:hypothetical protein